jgi:hypothetical protein
MLSYIKILRTFDFTSHIQNPKLTKPVNKLTVLISITFKIPSSCCVSIRLITKPTIGIIVSVALADTAKL